MSVGFPRLPHLTTLLGGAARVVSQGSPSRALPVAATIIRGRSHKTSRHSKEVLSLRARAPALWFEKWRRLIVYPPAALGLRG